MEDLKLTRDMAQLAILQRIELANKFLMRSRNCLKIFVFKNFSKYLINKKQVSKKYLEVINSEYKNIEQFLFDGQKILSIGEVLWNRINDFEKKFP